MKKSLAFLLAFLMMMSFSFGTTSFAIGKLTGASEMTDSGMQAGTKAAGDTHDCDYVIAANPSYSDTNTQSTGTLSVQGNSLSSGLTIPSTESVAYDVHPETDAKTIAALRKQADSNYSKKASYTVGSTKTFKIIENVNASSYNLLSVQFECLAVGQYCYIWTPVSGYTPLDTLGASYAASVQAHFDANYTKMIQAFGQPYNPEDHGKINLMYYDIQDGFSGSGSYIAGYFWGADMYSNYNGAAMINIDTNPAITSNGLTATYSTMYHELQHLINFSRTIMDTNAAGTEMGLWLNECMSSVAEELIIPNSAVSNRMSIWNSTSYPSYHLGASLYDFTNNLDAYAIVCFFGQYMVLQTSNLSTGVFSRVLEYVAAGYTDQEAIEAAVAGTDLEGMTLAEINHAFRAALVAFEDTGIYGFHNDSRFDPVKLTYITAGSGNSASIEGGGAVVYYIPNGTFTEPANAGELEYLYVNDGVVEVDEPPTECTVTFDPANGDPTWQVVIPYNTTVTEPATPVAPDGAPFKGWYKGGQEFNFATPIKRDTTITARYYRVNEIWSVDDLNTVRDDLSGEYVLMTDLTLSDSFAPIGNADNSFTGAFNGNGHTISGFTFNDATASNIGLFCVNEGAIRNLKMTLTSASQIVGGAFIGVITGQNLGVIAHCGISITAQLAMTAGTAADGGYLGAISGSNSGTIVSCHVTANKTATIKALYCGGISGENVGTISKCYTYLDPCTWANGYAVGGIVGLNAGIVDECRATGLASYGQNYDTSSYVGGLIGYVDGSLIGNRPEVRNSCFVHFASGTDPYVCADDYVGGLIGYANECAVINCYTYTQGVEFTSGASYHTLGIGCKDTNVTVTQSYACGTSAASNLTAGVTSWTQLKSKATNWDWTYTWDDSAAPFVQKKTGSTYRDSFNLTYATSISGATLPQTASYNYGDEYVVSGNVTIPASKLLSWKSSNLGETLNIGDEEYMPAYDIVLTANTVAADYTVSYDLDGGTGTATTGYFNAGDDVVLAAAPTKEDFEFIGWKCSYDENIYQAGAHYTMPAANVVFVAQYELEEGFYYVVYSLGGGTGVAQNTHYTAGTQFTLPAEPTLLRYVFLEWSCDYNNTGYAAGASFTMPAADVTFTAKYAPEICIVTFVDYDGTVLKTQPVEPHTAATAPTDPQREGYTFTGWDTDFGDVVGHITVTALYTINIYRVRFLSYDNSVLKTEYVEHGKAATAPTTVPSRVGHTFSGWDVDFVCVTGNMNVTAVYTPDTYRVRFLDFDDSVITTQYVPYGTAANAPTAPQHAGYEFVGWDTDFSCVTSALTVRAEYERIGAHTVTFVDYDDTVITAVEVEDGMAATAPADPTREGYDFTGWDTDFSAVTEDLTVKAEYEIKSFTITYYVDGSEYDSESYEYGKAITPIAEPDDREGYVFSGWSTIPATMPANDVNVYGTFTIITYTVTFVDYDGTELKNETVNYGGSATAPADPDRYGYVFTGWSTSFANVTSNIVVIAQYEINTYTVIFEDYDGTELKNEIVNHGASATAPVNPTREGYKFTGWSTSFTNVTSNIVVTAQYEINTYTVIFEDYDGAELKNEKVNHGDSATAPADPTREGYDFTGWDTDFSAVTEDLIVKAEYEIKTFTITYYVDGSEYDSESYDYGEAITPIAEPDDKEGYVFSGWSTIPATMPANDVNVYGTFTIITYTVTFVDYDGTELKNETVNYGGSATAPADPDRYGYIFTGWSTSFANVTSNIVVIAQYEINTYTVIFEDYDGTELKSEIVNHGASATAPANPTREGYKFTGWSTSFTNVTASIVVTAQYEINTYTVIFKDYDGKELKSEKVNHGDSATAPADPTREGYKFTGWSTSFTNVTASIVVTAQYEVRTFFVIYHIGDEIYDQVEFAYGATIVALSEPEETGFTFSGWSEFPETMPAHDVHVYASYTAKVYTITYYVDGEKYDTVSYAYLTTITPIAEPTRVGSTFSGWSTIPATMPANNLSVYGTFAINTYTVTFEDYDGTEIDVQTVEYGESATAPAAPSRLGYTFTGWDVAFGNVTCDLTVTAVYTAIVPTISLDGVRMYVSENTSVVEKFGYVFGAYTTLSDMEEAGIRYASTSKAYSAASNGEWTIYILTVDGREIFETFTIAMPIPTVEVIGTRVYVDQQASNVEKFAYAYGEFTSLSQMNEAGIEYENTNLEFIAAQPGVYTVYIRTSWNFKYFIKVTVEETAPTYTVLGALVTADENDNLVKFGRAIGEYTTYAQMQASGTLRMYSTSQKFYAPKTGTYTIYMRMASGTEYFYVTEIEVHVPEIEVTADNRVAAKTYLDEIVKFGYHLGTYDNYEDFNTTGVRYASTSKRTIVLDEGETYTIYIRMNDGREFFEVVTIAITAVQPTFEVTTIGGVRYITAVENKEHITKMGYVFGNYETLAEMQANGVRYCSTSKRFKATKDGIYTIHIIMDDGNVYFYHVNVG